MKFEKAYIFSLVAPLMILLSIVGFTLRKDSKKIFYLPIGLMGIIIISEKELSRGIRRKKIFNKIKSFKQTK
ncbi:DUF3188 domain-containing protein [Prochlorococcus sp. AH-716-K03]|nr:DUF3188 domain-containing protein [Prochlorococcus sp. AH-716-K03]|tara:strand:- start:31 stop:246 length:216 start_codon:yes stop_codon:yes gene_type:complete